MSATSKQADTLPAEADGERKLSDEDMARVEKYLSSPIHSVERKPFRPWLMMLGLLGVLSVLSLLSLLISWWVLG